MDLEMKRVRDDIVYLACRGDLDYQVADQFYSTVCKIDSRTIVVDFVDVEFLDSTGIGALCRVIETVKERNGKIRVVNIGENIYEVLNLVGCVEVYGDAVFSVKDSPCETSIETPASRG